MHYTLACFIFIFVYGMACFIILKAMNFDGEFFAITLIVSCFAVPVGLIVAYSYPSLMGNTFLGVLNLFVCIGIYTLLEAQYEMYIKQQKTKLDMELKKQQTDIEQNKQQYDLAIRRMKHDEALLKLEQDKLLGK